MGVDVLNRKYQNVNITLKKKTVNILKHSSKECLTFHSCIGNTVPNITAYTIHSDNIILHSPSSLGSGGVEDA
jgi:hypothetical protein